MRWWRGFSQVINNAAVGCTNGIWYAMPIHPMSVSATIHANDTWLQSLRTQPLLQHANNVVHSNANGLLVDNGVDASTGLVVEGFSYDPQINGVLIGATFEGVLAYKNYRFGVWIRGTLFEGMSANVDPPSVPSDWWPLQTLQPQYRFALELYDFGMQLVKNSTALHFDDPQSRVLMKEDRGGKLGTIKWWHSCSCGLECFDSR